MAVRSGIERERGYPSAGPGQQHVEAGAGGFGVGGSFLKSMLGYFELHVRGVGSKLEAWEVFLESILGLVEAKRQQGRGLEGLGLAQGWHGPT